MWKMSIIVCDQWHTGMNLLHTVNTAIFFRISGSLYLVFTIATAVLLYLSYHPWLHLKHSEPTAILYVTVITPHPMGFTISQLRNPLASYITTICPQISKPA